MILRSLWTQAGNCLAHNPSRTTTCSFWFLCRLNKHKLMCSLVYFTSPDQTEPAEPSLNLRLFPKLRYLASDCSFMASNRQTLDWYQISHHIFENRKLFLWLWILCSCVFYEISFLQKLYFLTKKKMTHTHFKTTNTNTRVGLQTKASLKLAGMKTSILG